MNALQFANRCCRQLDHTDFREISVTDQQSVLDAINKGLADIHYLLPQHLKTEVIGAKLNGPVTLGGTNSNPLYNYAAPKLACGRSFTLDGDATLNQFTSDSWLEADGVHVNILFPTTSSNEFGDPDPIGILYDDVVRLSSRVKSVSNVRIVGNDYGLSTFGLGRFVSPWGNPVSSTLFGMPAYYQLESVSMQGRTDQDENSTGGDYGMNSLGMLLRIYPIPTQTVRISFEVEYAPFSLTLSDTFGETLPTIPIIDMFHSELLTLVEAELSALPFFKGDYTKTQNAADRTRERLSREPRSPDTRPSWRGTPRGW